MIYSIGATRIRLAGCTVLAIGLPIVAGCASGGSHPAIPLAASGQSAAKSANKKISTTYSLVPAWVGTVSGGANDYVFTIPVFNKYPRQLVINGDVNGNLSIVPQSGGVACPAGSSGSGGAGAGKVVFDMQRVKGDPHRLKVNCNSGHEQDVRVEYTGGEWQYDHNHTPGQTQDCDAGCSAYASIDLYKGSYDGTDAAQLIQGDGPGATTNGNSTALATIDPLAIAIPPYNGLVDANYYSDHQASVTLTPNNTPLSAEITEANINHIAVDNQISFDPRQPTDGAVFGFNPYTSGSQFISGSAVLPVGASSGIHLPYNVALDIITLGVGGGGNLGITPPEPPYAHAAPQAFIQINVSAM